MIAGERTLNLPSDDEQRIFLGVNQSLKGRRWVDRLSSNDDRTALAISQSHGLSSILGRVLSARGVGLENVLDYLDPSLKRLMPDPNCLTDMEKAAERLKDAVERNQKIALFGDYDVDGATSCALMMRFLQHFGNDPIMHIPDRILEGYGPNKAAVEVFKREGCDLLITLDCGSTSHETLLFAQDCGMDVLVIDHHQIGVDLPAAHAIVNPQRQDDVSGLTYLAAVGVTFMVLVATLRCLREGPCSDDAAKLNLLALLDLVALGTVADVVPLKGLNRAFVVKGLIALQRMENRGLAALVRTARIDGVIEAHHLGFMLGPRINAGGRIADASLGARLLTMDDDAAVQEIAERLDVLNKERQLIEKTTLVEAEAQALLNADDKGELGEGAVVVMAHGDTWHPGVLGLVASRLKDKFKRPSIALAFDESGKATGSARSLPGVDLGKVIRAAVHEGFLVKGGGHAMAAGLTIERDKLDNFRTFLEDQLREDVARARAHNSLSVDGALSARGVTLDFIEELERAGPFGMGNQSPVFVLPSHRVTHATVVGQGHVKVSLSADRDSRLDAIAFQEADSALGKALLDPARPALHVAGVLSRNTWQGCSKPQLRIVDAAFANT